MIRHDVHNGFDAWRKLYHHHDPPTEDLQQIIIQELFELKSVSESDVDKLFTEMQRISEWNTKANTNIISEQ